MRITVAAALTAVSLVVASAAIAQSEHDHQAGGQHSAPAPTATPPSVPAPAPKPSPAAPASGMGGGAMKHDMMGQSQGGGGMGPGMMGQGHGDGGMDHSMMQMMQPTEANPYPHAEMQMHQKMMMATGADATETWVRKMIEHHRGAVEMARLLLTNTSDSAVRRMANDNISRQERDIASLQRWLTRNHKTAQ